MYTGFHYATASGASIGVDDIVIPQDKHDDHRRRRDGGEGDRVAVRVRPRDPGREVQQGHRHLVPGERTRRAAMMEGISNEVQVLRTAKALCRTRSRSTPSTSMADSGARGSRGADPAAGRHARPDGQAPTASIIETPISRELPRGADGERVLHLDPRRPQGPCRHGAQDGELGLPDAAPGGRGPGPRGHGTGLRHRPGLWSWAR